MVEPYTLRTHTLNHVSKERERILISLAKEGPAVSVEQLRRRVNRKYPNVYFDLHWLREHDLIRVVRRRWAPGIPKSRTRAFWLTFKGVEQILEENSNLGTDRIIEFNETWGQNPDINDLCRGAAVSRSGSLNLWKLSKGQLVAHYMEHEALIGALENDPEIGPEVEAFVTEFDAMRLEKGGTRPY